jgi:hypothetical protein
MYYYYVRHIMYYVTHDGYIHWRFNRLYSSSVVIAVHTRREKYRVYLK